MDRRRDAMRLVVAAYVAGETSVPDTRQVDAADAHTGGVPADSQHESGLLDLHPEAEGVFLLGNHRHHSWRGIIMAVPHPAT